MPDIDPDLPLRLAKTIADIYGDAATELLQAVARRLARGIDEPGWAEAKLAELIGLRDEARAVVDRLTVLGPDAVIEALTAAADKGATAAATELASTLKPVTSTPAVDALAEQTISQLDRTHMQILRSTDDVYRRVIAEVSAPGVVTGSLTQQQAAARALDRFAQKGVTGFVDRAGRRWELESYVEMATRTATSRAMIQGRVDVYTGDGHDIVVVSDAPEECAVCRPFEGRLLSISGRSTGQTVDGKRVIDSVKGAQAKGLFHPGCRHDLRPFIAGLSNPKSDTADPEGDRLRQEQRRLERRIREAKRRVAAAEPFGDPELGRAKARLKQRQADMRKFVADHDRKRFPEREKLRGPKSGGGRTPARAGSGPDVGSPSSGGSRHVPKVTGSELRSAPGTSRSARRPPGDPPKPASKAVKTFEDDHAKRVGTTALDAISKVHRIPPNLPKFTAVAEQLPRGDRAAFDPSTMTLALDPADGDAFSFVHEFGHWLDWTALKAREWSSVKDARLGEFRETAKSSQRYRDLVAEQARLEDRIRRRVASADDVEDSKHIGYLLQPSELWSRAYAQWVVTESGAPALAAGLKAMQPGGGSTIPDQWADDDFGPIAVVIRKLFESRGLLP